MSTTGNFFELGPSDDKFPRVVELDARQFPRPWSRNDWQDLNWSHHVLLGMGENELEGFALFGLVPGDDTAHLLKVCLKRDLRGTGKAEAFWHNCLGHLGPKAIKSVYLEVEASNKRAIGFYQKLGFLTLRVIKAYYSDGEDALTMLVMLPVK